MEAATACDGGCNRIRWRLQPHAMEAATVCDGGCNPMLLGLQAGARTVAVTRGSGWICVDLCGSGWIWVDPGGSGWIWVDLGGSGWIWVRSCRRPHQGPRTRAWVVSRHYHLNPGAASSTPDWGAQPQIGEAAATP